MVWLVLAACADRAPVPPPPPSAGPTSSPTTGGTGGTGGTIPPTSPELTPGSLADACVTGRLVGFPLRSTLVPAAQHDLVLRRIDATRFEVTGAPDGAAVELLSGALAADCVPAVAGGCAWLPVVYDVAIAAGGVAVFEVDTSGGANLQARDPATGDTSGVYAVPAPFTGFGASPGPIVPPGTYDGFGVLSLLVWVEAGDHVTVTGTLDIEDPIPSVSAPAGSQVVASPEGYDYAPYFEAVIGEAGWLQVGFGSAGWYSGTTYAEIAVTPSLRTWYADLDEDGHGDPASAVQAELRPAGYAGDPGDCLDSDPEVYTGAGERCGDGIDSDCDGSDASCATIDDAGDPLAHPTVAGITGVDLLGDLDGDGAEDLALRGWHATQLTTALRGDLCLAPLRGPAYLPPWRRLADEDGDGADSLLFDTDAGVWLVRGVPTDDFTATAELLPGRLDYYDGRSTDLTGDGLAEVMLSVPDGNSDTTSAWLGPYQAGDAPLATWSGVIDVDGLPDLDGDGLGEVSARADLLSLAFGPHLGVCSGLAVCFDVVSSDPDHAGTTDTDDVDGDGDTDLLGLALLSDVSRTGVVELATFPPDWSAWDLEVVGGDLWFTGSGRTIDGPPAGLYRIDGPLVGALAEPVQVREGVGTLDARDFDADGAEDLLLYAAGTASILFGP
jgi:hypothetical protein